MAIKNNIPAKKLTFTDRQLKVIQLWSELPNEAAIAIELNISEHTVHTHLRRMREKLKVRRTFDVWKYTVREKLTKS